jgi:hypothetical protein
MSDAQPETMRGESAAGGGARRFPDGLSHGSSSWFPGAAQHHLTPPLLVHGGQCSGRAPIGPSGPDRRG